jgi:hypothetical protein
MRPPRPGTNCRRADWFGGPARYHRIRQVSEVPLLLRSVICLAPSVCLFAARNPIVDAEENRYNLSLEGDLYLYVIPPEPQYRFLLCPLDRALDAATTHNTLSMLAGSTGAREPLPRSPFPPVFAAPCLPPVPWPEFLTLYWVLGFSPFFPLEGFGLACSGVLRSVL